MKHKNNYVTLILCFLIFLDSLGYGLILPIMPKLFFDHVSGIMPIGDLVHRNEMLGITFSLFPLASILGMPLLGMLSDKFGLRKILLLAALGLFIGYLIAIISILYHKLFLFMLSRLIVGFCSGSNSLAISGITILSDDENKKIKNLNKVTIFAICGSILGPGISAIFKYDNLAIPFITTTLLSIICYLAIHLFFKVENAEKSSVSINIYDLCKSVVYVFISKEIRFIAISYLLFQYSFGLFSQSISIYLSTFLKYDSQNIGEFFVFMAIIFSIGMALLPKILDKITPIFSTLVLCLIISSSVLFIGGIAMLLTTSINQLAVSIWVISAGFYFMLPIISVRFLVEFSNKSTKDNNGIIMGGSGQLFAIGFLVSSLTMSKINYGFEYLILITVATLIIVSALIFQSRYLINKVD